MLNLLKIRNLSLQKGMPLVVERNALRDDFLTGQKQDASEADWHEMQMALSVVQDIVKGMCKPYSM